MSRWSRSVALPVLAAFGLLLLACGGLDQWARGLASAPTAAREAHQPRPTNDAPAPRIPAERPSNAGLVTTILHGVESATYLYGVCREHGTRPLDLSRAGALAQLAEPDRSPESKAKITESVAVIDSTLAMWPMRVCRWLGPE